MPSDWSGLSTAERRAWSIEIEKPARRVLANAAAAAMERAESPDVSPSDDPIPTTSPAKRRRWGRRKPEPLAGTTPLAAATSKTAGPETLVIDLTEPEAVRATADSA
jgi:hypothetical protein